MITSPSFSRSYSILEDIQLSTAPVKKRNWVNKQKEIEENMNNIKTNKYATNNDELIFFCKMSKNQSEKKTWKD